MMKLVVNADPLNYTPQLVFHFEGGQLILYAYLLAVDTMTDCLNGRFSCKFPRRLTLSDSIVETFCIPSASYFILPHMQLPVRTILADESDDMLVVIAIKRIRICLPDNEESKYIYLVFSERSLSSDVRVRLSANE